MRLASDLTAAALIRDTAMRLFAERGAAAVTIRDIAAAAGVSPALVIHHYKSKDGLGAAVRARALQTITELAEKFAQPATSPDLSSVASRFAERLEADPALLGYLRRLLVDGGEPAAELFRRLYELTSSSMASYEASGIVRRAAGDASVRNAFLLVNDLGVIVLRDQIAAVLGFDPLGRQGIIRWTEALTDLYQRGISTEGQRT